MKHTNNLFFAALIATGMMTACSELEDKDHYKNISTDIQSDELLVVNETSQQYLQSAAEYSKMSAFFTDEGIYDELNAKGQLSTLLVVENDDYVTPEGTDDEIRTIARAHVSDVSMSPANLKTDDNSMRIMMWHGKYINVDLDDAAMNEGKIAGHIMMGTSAVKKVVKTNSGYIYVISNMISTPQSLNDYINALNDNYSIFRETVKASGGKEFDKKNSKPIGVNNEGNTVYDTVWVYTNEHFDEKGFDLNSESLTATMLVPSNDVIQDAMRDAANRLIKWGLWGTWNADRQYDFESTIRSWIMDVSFYNNKYTADELNNSDEMLTSIFSKKWKSGKQQVEDEPVELSNGVAYMVKKLYIPNNVLIYRLKEEFCAYEYCSTEQKEEYYKLSNIKINTTKTEVDAWTPLENVWPYHENRILECGIGDEGSGEWAMDFTPCRRMYDVWYTWKQRLLAKITTAGQTVDGVEPFLIPPGEYRFAFGAKQNVGLDLTFTLFAVYEKNGVKMTEEIGKSQPITLGSATNYHYDRGTTLNNRYPEWYDNSYPGNSSKAGNYDTDGGPVLDKVTVPDVYGDNSPVRLLIRIECPRWGDKNKMVFNHWCLRPTEDNY